jgi:hypothetical protein
VEVEDCSCHDEEGFFMPYQSGHIGRCHFQVVFNRPCPLWQTYAWFWAAGQLVPANFSIFVSFSHFYSGERACSTSLRREKIILKK